MRRSVLAALLASAAAAASCTSGGADRDPPATAGGQPRDYAGLHNVVAFREGFYSGGAPEGSAGFDTLAGMGVRTVISVDGAEPEVGLARARGIRYVHLPIGYNGFEEQRRLQLVRAVRDGMNEGAVYIHCHHGKHRSAAAAGAVAAGLGWLTPEAATGRMKVAGTAAGYTGLYACVAGAAVLGAATIDAVPADFPEVTVPAGLVRGMVETGEIDERLAAIAEAGWSVPADHPDLVPVAEAGRMADILRLLAGSDAAASKPAGFAAMMRESAGRAAALEDMLASGDTGVERLSGQYRLIEASCKDCHARYRD